MDRLVLPLKYQKMVKRTGGDKLPKQIGNKSSERNSEAVFRIVIPKKDGDKNQELLENLEAISDEDIMKMGEEIVALKKERENPQELKDFREIWRKNIDIDSYNEGERKEKIIKIVEKIPVKIEKESDGSRIIEFKLGNKTYKILDVNISTHNSDDAYRDTSRINLVTKNTVYLGGMMGDNKNDWKNRRLKEYIKHKESEGFHMPQTVEIRDLLNELGKISNLDSGVEQTAMLMYLTGMLGQYWLNMNKSRKDRRNVLSCNLKGFKGLHGLYNDSHWGGDPSGNIFMIACEDDSSVKNNTSAESETVVNENFRNIGTIAGMPVEFDESKRIVKFSGETFDLNPFEGKLSFMSKVSQYADLFSDEDVRKVMLALNI